MEHPPKVFDPQFTFVGDMLFETYRLPLITLMTLPLSSSLRLPQTRKGPTVAGANCLLAVFLRPCLGSGETKVVVYLDDQSYGQSQGGDVGVVVCVLAVRVGLGPVKVLVP